MDGHGGNVLAAARRFGRQPESFLDFSASINPLGLPEGARRAISEGATGAMHYPDPDYRELTDAVAAYLQVDPDCLVVANGASGALWNLLLAVRPPAVRVFLPAFSEYARGGRAAGVAVRTQELELATFCYPAPDAMPEELVFFCNPHNPLGRILTREEILTLVDRVGARGAISVVDEAFIDFLPDPQAGSLRREAVLRDDLVVLGSLTKFFALPGLRLGYLLASPKLARALREAAEPWRVNTLAAAAGAAALVDAEYIKRSRSLLPQWREELAGALRHLPGVEVFPSQANFLLLALERDDVPEGLARSGILVRGCSNFPPLTTRHVRVAVRTPEENRRLIEALTGLLD